MLLQICPRDVPRKTFTLPHLDGIYIINIISDHYHWSQDGYGSLMDQYQNGTSSDEMDCHHLILAYPGGLTTRLIRRGASSQRTSTDRWSSPVHQQHFQCRGGFSVIHHIFISSGDLSPVLNFQSNMGDKSPLDINIWCITENPPLHWMHLHNENVADELGLISDQCWSSPVHQLHLHHAKYSRPPVVGRIFIMTRSQCRRVLVTFKVSW